MKIIWTNQPLFKKVPLLLVLAVVFFVGFNIYLNLKIKSAGQELEQIESMALKPPRSVSSEFAKKIDNDKENCPYAQAGNPDAPLKFKLFDSETCPYCIAQNKLLDELLPEYGDLFFGEWYDVTTCIKESEQYKILGVPTFVFTAKGLEKEPAYGFLDRQQLVDYICQVSQQC
ncbi:hypothetical protein COU87_03565 [Candidatus Roizmanbacteria bacterium CG10_big_fil_rev_8_21_14_0_10_39_12]|uniref:Thioredoxin domain-containing protein n=1 Tax=Candidatus Roizmanbacteria bacterium CG10_big_fil_rev_8_21_14_0_10_39_12 TaxID=1974852 RepID=A0A2M8KNX6_9BACT|nr:MAG: hypothetical protein COU87_03565 [Candidatus Roizmanbacteria bacterium CG10_big_fil_rev_8_21_14_0_10_39_12]